MSHPQAALHTAIRTLVARTPTLNASPNGESVKVDRYRTASGVPFIVGKEARGHVNIWVPATVGRGNALASLDCVEVPANGPRHSNIKSEPGLRTGPFKRFRVRTLVEVQRIVDELA